MHPWIQNSMHRASPILPTTCAVTMDGADIYQLAKNGRTSVEMLEKYYVIHLKDMIDTAAVNIRKAHPTLADKEKTEKIQ